MSALKKHLSVANVLSVTALFVALGGSAYAAAKLGPGSVKTANIAKEAVTNPKLRAGSVTAGKIGNGAVIKRTLGNGAVGAAKLSTEAVTAGKLGKKSVTAAALGPEAATGAKIKNEAISQAKLASSLYGQLVKNVSYVTETSAFNSVSPKTAEAVCPAGKEVLGGGVRLNGDTTGEVVPVDSAPLLSGSTHVGWAAAGREVPATLEEWSVSAFAICATL